MRAGTTQRPIYLVVLRCTLDDVICGERRSLKAALVLMKKVLKDPEAEAKRHEAEWPSWDITGLIAVSLLSVLRDKVTLVEHEDV